MALLFIHLLVDRTGNPILLSSQN